MYVICIGSWRLEYFYAKLEPEVTTVQLLVPVTMVILLPWSYILTSTVASIAKY